jgi:nitrile hydratase
MSAAAARFRVGDRVMVRAYDPPHHTRAPRYTRGRAGKVVELHGVHRLPDDVVRGVTPPAREAVYAVAFASADLWGEGSHEVIVNLWESYLEGQERS